jgi:hypothetical protein
MALFSTNYEFMHADVHSDGRKPDAENIIVLPTTEGQIKNSKSCLKLTRILTVW